MVVLHGDMNTLRAGFGVLCFFVLTTQFVRFFFTQEGKAQTLKTMLHICVFCVKKYSIRCVGTQEIVVIMNCSRPKFHRNVGQICLR